LTYIPSITGISIPSSGVWLINYVIRIKDVGTVSRFFTNVTVVGSGTYGCAENSAVQTISATQYAVNSGSVVLSLANSGAIYVQCAIAGTPATQTVDSSSTYIQITRLA
jgi:hypothetical protein